MKQYKRINESVWSSFGKKLLDKENYEGQIEFLNVCRNGNKEFLSYLERNLLNKDNAIINGEIVSFNHKFCETEFRLPPYVTQKKIYETFKQVDNEYKTLPGFWCYIVINLIENGYISSDYLASRFKKPHETGIYEIDNSISSVDKTDRCVRRILRSMCNKVPRNSARDIYWQSLSKSYWRMHWANALTHELPLDFAEIVKVLDEDFFKKFADKAWTKKSYVTQLRVLGGLVLYLHRNPSKKDLLKSIIDTITFVSSWKTIECQSCEENELEVKAIVSNLSV